MTLRRAALFALLLATTAHAKLTSFKDTHFGVSTGTGLFYHPLRPLVNDNAFDPVPELAPSGLTVTGSDGAWLLPIKLGVFYDMSDMVVDVYGIYQISMRGTWTTSAGNAGTSSYGGKGFGGQITYYPWVSENIRTGFGFNTDYMMQTLKLASGGESMNLSTTSILVGIGPQCDLWLGDMWVLSIFAGYQWGMNHFWNNDKATTFFGQIFAAGTVENPNNSAHINAQFGGVLVQGMLKLNFQ